MFFPQREQTRQRETSLSEGRPGETAKSTEQREVSPHCRGGRHAAGTLTEALPVVRSYRTAVQEAA